MTQILAYTRTDVLYALVSHGAEIITSLIGAVGGVLAWRQTKKTGKKADKIAKKVDESAVKLEENTAVTKKTEQNTNGGLTAKIEGVLKNLGVIPGEELKQIFKESIELAIAAGKEQGAEEERHRPPRIQT